MRHGRRGGGCREGGMALGAGTRRRGLGRRTGAAGGWAAVGTAVYRAGRLRSHMWAGDETAAALRCSLADEDEAALERTAALCARSGTSRPSSRCASHEVAEADRARGPGPVGRRRPPGRRARARPDRGDRRVLQRPGRRVVDRRGPRVRRARRRARHLRAMRARRRRRRCRARSRSRCAATREQPRAGRAGRAPGERARAPRA